MPRKKKVPLIKRLKAKLAENFAAIFVVVFMTWLFLSLYTNSLDPIHQVEYIFRDIACKMDGGLDWSAGEKGCYRSFSFLSRLQQILGV